MMDNWCGNEDPHNPHEGCLGIMCDDGCGCVDEGLFFAAVIAHD